MIRERAQKKPFRNFMKRDEVKRFLRFIWKNEYALKGLLLFKKPLRARGCFV